MTEDNKAQNTHMSAPASVTEGYQAIQVGLHNKGYQSTTVSQPSVPPQGGSVIAGPVQTTGAPSAPSLPPQGGSVIAASPATPEQK